MEALRSELETEKRSVSTLKEAIKAYENGNSQAEAEKTRSQQAYKRNEIASFQRSANYNASTRNQLKGEEGLLEDLKGASRGSSPIEAAFARTRGHPK